MNQTLINFLTELRDELRFAKPQSAEQAAFFQGQHHLANNLIWALGEGHFEFRSRAVQKPSGELLAGERAGDGAGGA